MPATDALAPSLDVLAPHEAVRSPEPNEVAIQRGMHGELAGERALA